MAVLMQEVNELLDYWLHWYRFLRSVTWALRGLVFGLAIALILSLIALPGGLLLQEEYLRLLLAASAAGMAAGAGIAYFWPFPRIRAARFFDRCFGLKERVSTALELAAGGYPISDELRQRQLADAAAAARAANPKTELPLRLPHMELLVIVFLLLFAGLLWQGGETSFEAAMQNRLTGQAISQEADRLEELIAEIEQIQSLSPEQRQALSEPLQEALRQLQEAQSLEEAISTLNSAEAQLNASRSSQLQEQLQELQTVGEDLINDEGNPLEAVGQDLAAGDISSAAQALQDLHPQELSQDEREDLSERLDEAASALTQGNAELAEALGSAAEALRNGEPDAARESLQQAAETLAGAGQQALESQLSEQAAAQLRQSGQRLVQAANNGQTLAQNETTGQGQTAGEEQGAGQGEGQSSGEEVGGGAGRGESDGETSQGGEAGVDPIPQGNGPGDGGERDYEQIYAPDRLGGEGGAGVSLPGSGQPGDQVTGQVETPPGETGRTTVPYIEALPSYREAYRRAIESGQVPVHLRSLIRDYFGSLEP